jgi:NAD(P)-dependent dehydrogenase (short-subunit alcohol dehydrogenase family)
MTMDRNITDQVWLVTGCSSGLGRALSESVLERGGSLVATARNIDTIRPLIEKWPEQVKLCTLDVTRPDTITSAIENAIGWKGRIDVLVNNAGYGIVGAVEEVNEEDAQAAFDANFFGVYRVLRASLPYMRRQAAGHIVNVSSMLGHTSMAGFGLYSAVKFAVEGLSEALAKEVAPFGIGVTIVAPGPFRTSFRGHGLQMAMPKQPYEQTLSDFRRTLIESDGKQPGDPSRAGNLIIDAVNSESPPLHLILGEPALEQVRAKLASVAADMDRWERASVDTAFR